jgi:hypothetical protein
MNRQEPAKALARTADDPSVSCNTPIAVTTCLSGFQ